MALFVPETFIGHSGSVLHWKIECDALTDTDWTCLALMGASMMPPFYKAVGIPTGGMAFADALNQFADPEANLWLIVDDVWTTGGSVAEFQKQFTVEELATSNILVAFNRSPKALPWRTYSILDVHSRVAQ